MGFALRNASKVTPVFSLKDLMLFMSWFKLQHPFSRFKTWETLITRAVRGTFMSRTAYSGGMASPSDSPSESVSGSKASSDPLVCLAGLGGLDGLLGDSTTGTCATALLPPLRGPPVPMGPCWGERGGVRVATAVPMVSASVSATPRAPAASLERGPAEAPSVGLAGAGDQSFLSFQPEFTKSSDIGGLEAGALRAKVEV
mmetsp:Transcript_113594/g.253426  ORF Transcript_113594/g.253426 Transcript_113594/m.253426 type:complete len:200 (-) Transcript_113594:64-663(-)